MAGRWRARTGQGWDAAPPRATGRSRAPAPGVAPPADPAERAREICLRQLAVRPRTRRELAAALRRHGIASDVAAAVLERYTEVGIIDDRVFARAWVTSRHHGRGLSRRALAAELRRKGVDAEAVGAALAELDPAVEAKTARTLVERRLRTDHGGPPDAVFRRLVGMLARKGYPAGVAVHAVREALAERGGEAGAGDMGTDPDMWNDIDMCDGSDSWELAQDDPQGSDPRGE